MNIKSIIKKVLNKVINYLYRTFYYFIPVNKKTVLFIAYHGRGYLCNPKAIHQYMSECSEYKVCHSCNEAMRNLNMPGMDLIYIFQSNRQEVFRELAEKAVHNIPVLTYRMNIH